MVHRRERHLVEEYLEPPCAGGARLPLLWLAGGDVSRLPVHRQRDHIWPQLREEGAVAQGEQGAEAVLVPHALQHRPATVADLVTTTAAAVAAAAAAATVAAAASACGRGGCCSEGGAHGAGELREERILP